MFGRPLNGLIAKPTSGAFAVGPWGHVNVAASLTDNGTPVVGAVGAKLVSFTRDAYLVGISLTLEGGSTTGTITVTPFLNDNTDPGTDYDLAMANSAANADAQKAYTVPVLVTAGTTLRVKTTTTADWNGTGGDVNVMLELRFV